MKSGSPSRTTAAHKTQTKIQAWSSLVFHHRHSSFNPFRSSSVGLETGEWRRCRSLPFTPPASLRSHGFRPRPTRHMYICTVEIAMPYRKKAALCIFNHENLSHSSGNTDYTVIDSMVKHLTILFVNNDTGACHSDGTGVSIDKGF